MWDRQYAHIPGSWDTYTGYTRHIYRVRETHIPGTWDTCTGYTRHMCQVYVCLHCFISHWQLWSFRAIDNRNTVIASTCVYAGEILNVPVIVRAYEFAIDPAWRREHKMSVFLQFGEQILILDLIFHAWSILSPLWDKHCDLFMASLQEMVDANLNSTTRKYFPITMPVITRINGSDIYDTTWITV